MITQPKPLRIPLTVTIRTNVIMSDGTSKARYDLVKKNRLSKLSGPGFTGENIYKLQKLGWFEYTDESGATFEYYVLSKEEEKDYQRKLEEERKLAAKKEEIERQASLPLDATGSQPSEADSLPNQNRTASDKVINENN